jgi:3-hydroxy-9,10-secoandrosta-1,3,5(10)-triene-9,17-dione monooxygenase reductase component
VSSPKLGPGGLPTEAVTQLPELRDPDASLFRYVLGHYPTGVAVITGTHGGVPIGLAMNSFTSVSLDPPLILFCPALESSTWPILRRSRAIAVNVLSAQQEAVSRRFSSRTADRFAGLSWSSGENGSPLLADALGWLECRVEAETPAGDHTVVTARIERMGIHTEIVDPLLFFRGRYYPGLGSLPREAR